MPAMDKLDTARIHDIIRQPHDALFRELIRDPERADVLIREHFPDTLRHLLNGARARHGVAASVSPLLEQAFPDGVFEFGGSPGRPGLALVMEHSRNIEWPVVDRLAAYVVGARRSYRQAGIRPDLIAMLVTTGSAPVQANWATGRKSGSLSLLEVDPIRLLCLWLAVAETTYEALSSNPVIRGVLGALRSANVDPPPIDILERVFHDLSSLPRGASIWGMTYVFGLSTFGLERMELDKLIRAVDPKRMEAEMPTMFQKWMVERDALSEAKGRAEGRVEGRAEGRTEGRVEGRAQGRTEGRAEGRAQGRTEGRVEGRTEGRADLLLRQLRLRFGALPADIEARVRSSSTDELEVWSDAIFDARSLEDLFGKSRLN